MKTLKLPILIIAFVFAIGACKKNEFFLTNEKSVDLKYEARENNLNVSNTVGFGECATKLADSLRKWANSYGAGGSKFHNNSGAVIAYADIINHRIPRGSASGFIGILISLLDE